MSLIKIMRNTKFDLDDLVKKVDFSHDFTLRDLLMMVMNSEVPIKVLQIMLHCPFIEDYWKEAESKPFSNDGNIEYLEIYWWGTKSTHGGEIENNNSWCFHGVGYLDNYDADMIEMYKYMKKELPKNYRQPYAIEFSPMYKLADYQIKMSPKLHMTDYDAKLDDDTVIDVDFTPSITLIELLHAIFWELSFIGSIEERDLKKKELEKSVEEIHKASKEGRLDEVTVSHDKVKAHFEEKFGKEE